MSRAEERDVDAYAPDLVWAEVAHTLRRYVRTDRLDRARSNEILLWLLGLPIVDRPLRPLAPAAAHLSQIHDLSAYDAFYLALAEAAGATLVTADRRLASLATTAAFLT